MLGESSAAENFQPNSMHMHKYIYINQTSKYHKRTCFQFSLNIQTKKEIMNMQKIEYRAAGLPSKDKTKQN